ncbi:SET and MYND domain-containing protein 4 [Diplogelasinospora grovesii]|uniref:SET and MYND domain-containing protein 4 n=1 Tax=Diplogelasinospora grovesii TaxID=303347 RepID=A0AAN6NKE1_9PEZI|nr:SET and MYND domain-containing protein 4 [Diplogelasinospora grovesii]
MAVAVADLKGKVPPRRLPKEELARTHKAHLKKQDLTPDAPRPVKQPIMEEAYPASTRPIRDLDIISLGELRVETHHRGQGIIVKVISPPYIGAGVVSIVEDEFGNADKLAVYNQGDSSILSGVPEGCIVAVKEPYYKHNGAENDYMICVDHPSDVILLRFTDPIIPEPLRLGPLLKSAEDWRTAGDKAFIERDFPTAVFCYTEALEAADEKDKAFRAPICAKRAGTNLILCRYDTAKADALASRTGGLSDWKAYYSAGRAAYGLCDYATSKVHLEEALKINPDGSGVRREYERCLARLREEEHGKYDFAAMLDAVSPQSVHMDNGSFLRATRVAESKHHGRGLFTTRALKAGDIVFVEKATLMPNQYEPARASAALYAMMVRQLCDNPSLAQTVMQLYPGQLPYDQDRHQEQPHIVDGVQVVDVFAVEGIRTKNCFSAPLSTLEDTKPSSPEGRMAKGLWAHASYMNHSCVPNTMRSFIGDMLISRATRDIAEGEEIFQQYVPVRALVDLRNAQFREGWGFECGCALCGGERRSSSAMLEKRKEALQAVEKACNKKQAVKAGKGGVTGIGIVPDATIRQVDKLMRQLEDLHEPDVYGDLMPRLTLIYPSNWLVEAHRGRKNHVKVIKYALKVLRNFGFNVPRGDDVATTTMWEPGQIFTTSPTALMTIHVVAALRRLAGAYDALDQREMAERCAVAAKFGYTMVTGFENDLNALDQ